MPGAHLVTENREGKTNKSPAAEFWVISLLFWEVVKTGSITGELPERRRVVINHRRGVVLKHKGDEV